MKNRTYYITITTLLLIVSFNSCYELQSDAELKQDIVGTWKKEKCRYPYADDKDIEAYSVLNVRPELKFNAGGAFDEIGTYAYCCSNGCDTATQGTCTWTIEEGALVIIPTEMAEHSHLNQPFPIKCLKENLLVFDNVEIQGVPRKKTCYCRE